MKPGTWALRHVVPVGVVTAGAVLFGLLALSSLKMEFIPSLTMPSMSVVSLWPGVGAEDVEDEVTSVLEDSFTTLPGLRDMNSESREGVSIIVLQFSEDAVTAEILQEIRNRVERSSGDLPDGLLGDPVISTFGATDLPVFSFTVSGPWSPDGLSAYVEDTVIPEIYRVDGVAKAHSLGDLRKELKITLLPDAMAAMNVAPLEVAGAIQSRNTALPSGLVEWNGGEWAFRVSGEFRTAGELAELVVGSRGSLPVHLDDIAEITETYERPGEKVRTDSGGTVVIQVTKRENGDAMRMSRDIRRRLGNLRESTPGTKFTILHDDSETIRLALRTVLGSAATGIVMAVLVIWVFLRSWRWTLVIAISLPTTLVIVFAAMKLAGQTVNVLTMAGITVSLGMMVDASIVVLENIHRQSRETGDADKAAERGVGLVSGAVVASTTTSVSVFTPTLFLSGIIGIVMKDLALTLVFCLGASLFAALFLVPPLARRGMIRFSGRPPKDPGFMKKLESSYRTVLERALDIRGTVVFAAVLVFAASIMAAGLMGISFIPAADYGEVFVSLELPPGSTLDDSAYAADCAAEVIRREIPEAGDVVFFVGMDDELSGDARRREAVWGQVLLEKDRTRKQDFRSVIDRLNEHLPPALPGTSVAVYNGGFDRMVSLAADGAGYRVELSSESWEDLKNAARQVEGLFARDPDILGFRRNVTEERRMVTANLDGEVLGMMGVDASAAAMSATIAYDGIDVGSFHPDEGEDRNIRLTTTEEGALPDSSSLIRIPLRSASGTLVSLDSVSEVKVYAGVSGIRRHNRARTMTIIAQSRDENVRDIERRLRTALEKDPPPGVDWKIRGIGGLVKDSFSDLALVLVVSLFLVYAVMAIQFERLVQPLIIMASVPFCFIGAIAGLAAFDSDISLVAFLGIIALAGIVVNNAIVQVDRINQLREGGMGLREAVISGSVGRLRPIMMTTFTTFFGVLPLSLARGGGARIYAPLGQAIAGGLLTSTLVTLFLIPVLYLAGSRGQKKRPSQ